MFHFLNISSISTSQLFAYAGGLFSDLWVLIAIFAGLPLAFYIINKIIDLMPSEKKHRELMTKIDKEIARSENLLHGTQSRGGRRSVHDINSNW